MSKFHATVRELLEDVYCFLVDTLQKEAISNPSIVHKEKLLSRLRSLEKEYPELHLNFENFDESTVTSVRPTSSPLPYVDMNGGSPYRIPFVPANANVEKDSYDLCFPTKDKSDAAEIQSVTESEGYVSDEVRSLPEVSASELYACEKSGYLDKKKRDSIKGWLNPFQKRWCAIKDGVLYYYEKTTDRKQKGSIILSGYEVRAVLEDNKDGKKYNFCFELVCPGRRTYQFSAPSEKDLQQWISVIEQNSRTLNLGKTFNRDSQLSPSAVKELDMNIMLEDIEDIYETVEEEDDSHLQSEKKEIEESYNDGNVSLVSSDESSQNQIFNYNEWYVGLWDCFGSDEDELSFYRGDLIHIVSKEYDNYAWWIGELQGKVGFVPKSYLMEANEAC
ncbi:src kinase-associated phosphoprotein 2-B [Parasteatoda tepidariorum]|uniref:src kinase-associated phosphoprotein 2-B n=1 Tax=Parasteatoda tepidariorum TaxID=114398 RepID=UPI00077FCE1C|nr:src kinase-associated phosphoprotein 2-B [Parasteatoda tepidariorum]